MPQLNITKSATPDTITIRVTVDPYNADSPTTVAAMVWAVDGTLLAAHSCHLRGLEEDYLDSIVQTALEAWRWGAPAQQLAPAMKRIHKAAKAHAKAHGRA